jgi:crossover junction endodeoxyribonuclease RuvC
MRVLGVDPGSSATGYGLVVRDGGSIRHLDHGVLRPPGAASLAERLGFLHDRLLELVRRSSPDVAVVERVFLASNPRSALILGQARGAILAGLGEARVPVSELAARQVKKAVTGSGAADKSQIQAMVGRLLALEVVPPTDAADALALAIGYAQAGPLAELASRGRRRGPSRRRRAPLVLGRAR